MKRAISALAVIAVVALAAGPSRGAAPQIRHISPALQKAVAEADYAAVRIKNFPFAAEAWTFRKFTFADTLKKLKELGVGAVEAFPGQALGAELAGAQFGETMTDAQVAFVKQALKASGA